MARRSSDSKRNEEEYVEEADMLYVFPPEKIWKGDYVMSVLMSG